MHCCSDLLAKTKSLIHGKLECLEIVEKAVSQSNLDHADEVAVFVVFALEVCSTERSRKPELLKMCFDIVKMLLHSQKELDSDCVLGPLLFYLFLKVRAVQDDIETKKIVARPNFNVLFIFRKTMSKFKSVFVMHIVMRSQKSYSEISIFNGLEITPLGMN